MSGIGKALILFGVVLVVVGVVFLFADKVPWLGKLPGDIHIKKDNFSFYFPFTTCLLIGLAISAVLYFLGRR